MYISGGTCTALIVIGGSTSKLLYHTLCGSTCISNPLPTVEWYLVFTCAAVVLSQLPHLNSIAGVLLVGGVTAVGYCTAIWSVSVAEGRLPNVSYTPVRSGTEIAQIFDVLNALGIITFAFRGHNLILEIQATMPSDEKHPLRVPEEGSKFEWKLSASPRTGESIVEVEQRVEELASSTFEKNTQCARRFFSLANSTVTYFKAGAMNALIRVSLEISNAPIILNVDCDMYSSSIKDALCFFLDEKKGHDVAFVQFALCSLFYEWFSFIFESE